MDKILIILSALGLIFGLLFMSEATTGVGIIAAAGVLGIWARIAQSSMQHAKMMALLEAKEKTELTE